MIGAGLLLDITFPSAETYLAMNQFRPARRAVEEIGGHR